MERKPGHFLEQSALRGITQGQIVASVAALAKAERRLKINVPNGGGTVKMFGRKLKPEARGLLRVEENQVGWPFPFNQRLAGAKFKEFMGRNHDMPVRLPRERASLVTEIHTIAQFLKSLSEQVPDFVEKIIAERIDVECKAQRRWRMNLVVAHEGVV